MTSPCAQPIERAHIRGEADELLKAVAEAIRIGRESGEPVHIAHFKAMQPPNWDRIREAAALIERARAQGLKVTADQYPYTANSHSPADAALPEANIQWCRRSELDTCGSCFSSPRARRRGFRAA